jgi:hypothetical protein
LDKYFRRKDAIQLWKLYIVEITIPFGRQDAEEESNALKKIIKFKI